jgi:hypothetical protein
MPTRRLWRIQTGIYGGGRPCTLAQIALLRPSPKMSHSTRKRVPGDTLRQLIEEHDQIEEFKRSVRERYGVVPDSLG